MYEKFYQLSEKPFNTTPDSKFFFPSAKHSEALNSLIYAINERKGFVVITGDIGAGKTTVYRTLLNKLHANTRVATIINSNLTPKEIIASILDEFEVEYQTGNKQKLLNILNKFLIQQLSADVNIVLIIDEAQNLSAKALEEVRMLSNLETEKEKLLQIILVGQPQLRQKLDNPKLEQFKQRIAVYYHLNPLNKDETREYIQHRVRLVNSGSNTEIFAPEAIELIHHYTKGVPRVINLLCDSCLLTGYIYEAKTITADIVKEVIREKELSLAHPVQQEPASKGMGLHCCSQCRRYNECELKWVRGTRNEEQLCCETCQHYLDCLKEF